MIKHSLSSWYADPLSVDEAERQLSDISQQLKQAGDEDYLPLRILEVSARFWLDRDISGDIENLLATCKDDNCQALIKLVYGQLLLSRKLSGAMDYLQQGFRQASQLFAATEYFEVMQRHERLKHLVLTTQAAAGRTLQELLQEADVIKALRGKADHHCDIRGGHEDTVG